MTSDFIQEPILFINKILKIDKLHLFNLSINIVKVLNINSFHRKYSAPFDILHAHARFPGLIKTLI